MDFPYKFGKRQVRRALGARFRLPTQPFCPTVVLWLSVVDPIWVTWEHRPRKDYPSWISVDSNFSPLSCIAGDNAWTDKVKTETFQFFSTFDQSY